MGRCAELGWQPLSHIHMQCNGAALRLTLDFGRLFTLLDASDDGYLDYKLLILDFLKLVKAPLKEKLTLAYTVC